MTCLHNIRYKKLYDNKVFPLGSTEKLLSSTQNDTFSNPRRYSFRHGKKPFTTRKDAYPPLEKYRDLLPNRWKKQ